MSPAEKGDEIVAGLERAVGDDDGELPLVAADTDENIEDIQFRLLHTVFT